MRRITPIMAILLATASCTNKIAERPQMAKFEPTDGECYIFAGQDVRSIGGQDIFYDGYCDHFQTPAGVTHYMGLGAKGSSMSGLTKHCDWERGECDINRYIDDDTFDGCMIAIGLSLVGGEDMILSGAKDSDIEIFGNWLNSLNGRPIFLRVGYEFEGFAWNHYKAGYYIAMYRYVKDHLDKMGVSNVAYVWQSKGWETTAEEMEEWYPGDTYVDWCAYSYFAYPDTEMIDFARSKGKPVMIAEATPAFCEGRGDDEIYTDADIKKPEIAKKIWNEWFAGLFKVIEENGDTVKALAYINTDWYAQEMWVNSKAFQKIDSRLQMSPYVSERWSKKLEESKYLNLADIK